MLTFRRIGNRENDIAVRTVYATPDGRYRVEHMRPKLVSMRPEWQLWRCEDTPLGRRERMISRHSRRRTAEAAAAKDARRSETNGNRR